MEKNGRKKPKREVFTSMKNSLIFTISLILSRKSSPRLESALRKKLRPELRYTRATIWVRF